MEDIKKVIVPHQVRPSSFLESAKENVFVLFRVIFQKQT